jgi:lysylphosphatidylglycerol synthetase-like protein (DUF2156 family)
MTPAEYGQTLLGWHDFFLASAGATAALLGLLFVGVSINLSTIAGDERPDLRARAAQAFANLVFVLVVSLLLLVPDPDPGFIAAGLAAVAAFGLYRIVVNLVRLRRDASRKLDLVPTLRRIGWTAVADLILAFTAWRTWDSAGRAQVIPNLIVDEIVLLIGAADIACEMLTEVG